MYHHVKRLMYTVNVDSPDPRFGNMLLEQFGGANGELAAALQYSIQGLNCEDPARKDLLMDIGTEELSHLEIVGALARLHLKPMKKDREAAEADPLVAIAGGGGVTLCNSMGNAWTADYLKITGELDVDLRSNIAAEARAKIVYERLINFCDDAGTKDALQFLMTREITHMKAFMAALDSMGKPALSIGKIPPTKGLGRRVFQRLDRRGGRRARPTPAVPGTRGTAGNLSTRPPSTAVSSTPGHTHSATKTASRPRNKKQAQRIVAAAERQTNCRSAENWTDALHHRRQHLARAGERSSAVHRHEIVDQRHVAGLPGDVERQFLGQANRNGDRGGVERRIVAQRDRLRGVVAGVFPTTIGGDQLIEKRAAAVGQLVDAGQNRRPAPVTSRRAATATYNPDREAALRLLRWSLF